MKSFNELFGKILPKDVCEEFNNPEIIKCDVNLDERCLNLCLKLEKALEERYINTLKNSCIAALKLNTINLTLEFSEEKVEEKKEEIKPNITNITVNDLTAIIEKIKVSLRIVGGFLEGAELILNGNVLEIVLKHGGLTTIENSDFIRIFNEECIKAFNTTFKVRFSGETEFEEIEVAVKPKAAVRKEAEYKGKPKDGLPVYLESARYIFGKAIKNPEPIKMVDIVRDEQNLVVWGEVINLESTPTKRGDKNWYKFILSDHTNSVQVKTLMTKEQLERLKPLQNGSYILLSGAYSFDDWEKDFIIKPYSIALVKKYEEMDEAQEKRVELHCHTNMSAKDACASATDLINRAYSWGHKAIAITDHGVVQSFPLAADAVKKIRKSGGEFKVIYGVEAYFFDDSKHDITTLTTKQIGKLRYHQIILVKNFVGLKNLYKLISYSHLDSFYGRPVILKSVLDKHREGLILGSACEKGELYVNIVAEESDEKLLEIASYYDYLEIQPLGNNEFMVRESALEDKFDKKTGALIPNRFKHVKSLEVIKNFNRKVVEIADKLNKPVVATGDVHFLKKEDDIIRKIMLAGQGYDDFDNQAPLHLKTTDEMLAEFDYFGERAKEFVVDNPNKIADMIDENIVPIPEEKYPPVIEGSDDLLREICWNNAHKKYGEQVPEIVSKRLEKELNSIISNGFSIMYISAQKLVAFSEEHGYLVGSRGSVGSSFVATMAGISEVNPLAPHYVCAKCCYSEFFTDGSYGSGFDLPEKICPICGEPLERDGHDIPFETFLGFKGDKVPDIDLNFSDEVQSDVQKYTEELFGSENVFKAGTVSTVAEKTAYGFSKAYAEKKGITLNNAELNRLAATVEASKIKQTTGQHPAGMIVIPRDKEIYDFCPVQHPADKTESDIITTHFEFKYIHDTILKLDELGHVIPTTYKYLEEYSGVPVTKVSMSDPKIYSLFTSTEALGVKPEDIYSNTGTFCLPEFGTSFVRGMLEDCKPKNFSDLLQISGLSHGEDVYLGNAKDLIDNGTCTISEVIGTRDNIMVYLIHKGMDEARAFKITETVRKGLIAKGEISPEDWAAMEADMRAVNVPEWYIDSCRKIKYMFPKAHASAYVISAIRVAWYKVYKPLAFYCAYFTARPEDVDVPTILKGHAAVKQYIKDIEAKGHEASKKELDVYNNMLIFNEIMARGIEVLPIDINKSHAVKFVPEDGKMRLPFGALSGVGKKAAYSIYEAAQAKKFLSKEDFRMEAGVSKTIIDDLANLGAFGDLPDTNQLSLF